MTQYFSFQWHITDECDQRCEHCYIFAEDKNAPLYSMSWVQMQDVLQNCLNMCEELNRLPYFYITGGDPILHPHFWPLLEKLHENNIPFTILGNPFHLSDEVCQRLKQLGCERYQLSIDGLRKTHDWFRKPGSFDTTLKKISTLNKAGIRSVVMTTVSGVNIKEIPSIIDLVVQHKVNVFAFARYCPTGDDKENKISPEEYKALLDTCWQKFEIYKDSGTTFNLKDHLWTLYLYEKGLYTIPENTEDGVIYDGCNCGISHMTILPRGEVYACRRMGSKVGNVFENQLSEIFTGRKMDRYRNFEAFEKCAKCELLRFCRGCPAVAFGTSGKNTAADPQCWKEVTA